MVPGADAVAIASGRVLAVGPGSSLTALAGAATRVIDAGGATVCPGFTDAHLHLVQWARSLEELDLAGAATREVAIERVAAFLAARPDDGSAVVGRGWDANLWSAPPERLALDRVSGARPVLLHSRDFHNLWVNSAALTAAGIGRATPDPAGGRIERDAAGEPTGLLREHAVRLCTAAFQHSAASDLALVRRAVRRLHAEGITAVHDFESADALRVMRETASDPSGRVRVLMHLSHAGLDHALALGLGSGLGDDAFRIGGVKLFADGTLGSRSAAMLQPYDGTEERGDDLLAPAELARLVARAVEGGLAVAIHAIGDRACRSSLDAFEAAFAAHPRPALSSRIEHAQLVAPDDLPRFARLGVAASMQPIHCTSDRELAERWWGSRRAHSYPWRSLLDSGALLAFGSDAPVERPSVAEGLHAAVTRRRPGDATAYVPEQSIGLDAALRAYAEGGPRLAGTWPRLGTLRPGAIADVVVWNADLHALEPTALRDARPSWTVLEGEIVHGSEATAKRDPSSPLATEGASR